MGPSRPPRVDFVLGFPERRYGEMFPFVLFAGWEWDGKVVSHLVDGTGREYTISWWDGTDRDQRTGREIGREH